MAISLEKELTGHDNLYFETTRADDDSPELPTDSYGLTGPIVYFQKLMDRWSKLDPSGAREELQRWPHDRYIFARLRIWAAGRPFLPPAEAAKIFLALPDELFWGTQHDRDLLFALRDRWPDLSTKARASLERRLLSGGYPWEDQGDAKRDQLVVRDRLSRLHWLSAQGVKFGFDVEAKKVKLKMEAPEWTPREGDEIAESRAPKVFNVERDDSADVLFEVPISEILNQAKTASSFDFRSHLQREPFRGLATRRPSRALGALTHAARQGEAPRWAWSEFLQADGRLKDSPRMVRAIARRLQTIPIGAFGEIAYPVTDWMDRFVDLLYGEAAITLEGLWNRIIEALTLPAEAPRRRPEHSWANDAAKCTRWQAGAIRHERSASTRPKGGRRLSTKLC